MPRAVDAASANPLPLSPGYIEITKTKYYIYSLLIYIDYIIMIMIIIIISENNIEDYILYFYFDNFSCHSIGNIICLHNFYFSISARYTKNLLGLPHLTLFLSRSLWPAKPTEATHKEPSKELKDIVNDKVTIELKRNTIFLHYLWLFCSPFSISLSMSFICHLSLSLSLYHYFFLISMQNFENINMFPTPHSPAIENCFSSLLPQPGLASARGPQYLVPSTLHSFCTF